MGNILRRHRNHIKTNDIILYKYEFNNYNEHVMYEYLQYATPLSLIISKYGYPIEINEFDDVFIRNAN